MPPRRRLPVHGPEQADAVEPECMYSFGIVNSRPTDPQTVLGLRFTRCVGYAESVQHHSPGQAHVSETNVSAALGYGVTQWFGRASDSPIEGPSAEAEMGPAMRRSHRDSRWQRALGFGLGKRRSNGYSLTRPLGPARSVPGAARKLVSLASALPQAML